MLSSPKPTTAPITDHPSSSTPNPPLSSFSSSENVTSTTKRKRRPAGTPDPDAEVVSLSPKTLLESDRYVCEICNQGFQRDQNLQMHRRRHKVPWKLLKKPAEATETARKRVYVCPEPSCLHHEPGHALGDLVGIKKHFRRKHSNHRQWVCTRCGKGYAVQSDYKAHLKTCGTRGHACDCGRVFSRVESFIEHQDSCNAPQMVAGLSQTASSTSPSIDSNFAAIPAPKWPPLSSTHKVSIFSLPPQSDNRKACNPELQLQPASFVVSPSFDSIDETKLQLSVGLSKSTAVSIELQEELSSATRERALADEAREQAKDEVIVAERELANAKRLRQQAQVELQKALAMRENAAKKINMMLIQITCNACKQQNQSNSAAGFDEATSHVSS